MVGRRIVFEPRFEPWRDQARQLLIEGVPPQAVDWVPATGQHQESLFGGELVLDLPGNAPPAGPERTASSPPPRVPKHFPSLAREVSYHRDEGRWALLYRVLWRLTHGGERNLTKIDVDPDVAAMRAMHKAVRRDSHKMKAFVRFRRVDGAPAEDVASAKGEAAEPWYIAWHRPDHHIVEKVAPFFVERFNDQRWVILTPDRSASWDLEKLEFGPGAPRDEAPDADVLEDLWRTYYRSIFNPARLKVRAMKAELPVRHWATLPEANTIPELVLSARDRSRNMLDAPEHPPARSFFPPERDLQSLSTAIRGCRACTLCTSGRVVFGEGPSDARLVLVGEQPGDQEERQGRPFVGPAGQVLDAALEAAGLDRDQLYLTNVVKHFSHEIRPDPRAERGVRRIHRTPGQTEVSACFPWLEEELEQLRPPLLVCLGATAARAVVGNQVRMRRDRGRPVATPYAPFTLVTYHPSAVLRVPDPTSRAAIENALRSDLALAAEALERLSA